MPSGFFRPEQLPSANKREELSPRLASPVATLHDRTGHRLDDAGRVLTLDPTISITRLSSRRMGSSFRPLGSLAHTPQTLPSFERPRVRAHIPFFIAQTRFRRHAAGSRPTVVGLALSLKRGSRPSASTPDMRFMPKYQSFPFFVEDISGHPLGLSSGPKTRIMTSHPPACSERKPIPCRKWASHRRKDPSAARAPAGGGSEDVSHQNAVIAQLRSRKSCASARFLEHSSAIGSLNAYQSEESRPEHQLQRHRRRPPSARFSDSAAHQRQQDEQRPPPHYLRQEHSPRLFFFNRIRRRESGLLASMAPWRHLQSYQHAK